MQSWYSDRSAAADTAAAPAGCLMIFQKNPRQPMRQLGGHSRGEYLPIRLGIPFEIIA